MTENTIKPEIPSWKNPLEDKDSILLDQYLEVYKNRILQDSEVLFVRDFLFPLLGKENIL